MNDARSNEELPQSTCAACGKPSAICVCDRIETLQTRVKVLVLQHPQEDDVALGTARLLSLSMPQCTIVSGLSWANLRDALGEEADLKRWVVLRPTERPADLPPDVAARPALFFDAKGNLLADEMRLDGVVALDGTWSQAKTLWWRNAWLLKLGRVSLHPREPSMYGKLRKEPRRDWVSTLEAVSDVLPAMGESEDTRDALRRSLRTMLQRARDARPAPQKQAGRRRR